MLYNKKVYNFIFQSPWLVSIGYRIGTKWIHQCSGSITSPNRILSTSSCFKDEKGYKPRLSIRTNFEKSDKYFNQTDIYDINTAIMCGSLNADISVVHSKTRILFNENVKPICTSRVAKYARLASYSMVFNGTDCSSGTPLVQLSKSDYTAPYPQLSGILHNPDNQCKSAQLQFTNLENESILNFIETWKTLEKIFEAESSEKLKLLDILSNPNPSDILGRPLMKYLEYQNQTDVMDEIAKRLSPSRFLVVSGHPWEDAVKTEFIDLMNKDTNCILPDFPFKLVKLAIKDIYS